MESIVAVQRLTGKRISVFVKGDETIASVKAKLQAEGKVPGPMRMTFGGIVLEDNKTLSDYSAKEHQGGDESLV